MFSDYKKKLRSADITLFDFLSFLIITSFAVRLVFILISPDSAFKKTSLMANSRVFTSVNSKYSALLGGEVQVTALKSDGSYEELKALKPLFNHSYNKVITNLILSKFENSVEKRNPKVSSRYLAAKQIFCADPTNEKVEIKRKLVLQNKNRKTKEYTNVINCKN